LKLIIVATLLLALMAPQPAMAQSTNSTAAQVATLREGAADDLDWDHVVDGRWAAPADHGHKPAGLT
jgi:hypothetical protein